MDIQNKVMVDTRKTVFITGCSGIGIGNHLASKFNEHGYRVFATARAADSLKDLASQGVEALSLTVDEHESVIACFENLKRRLNGRGLDYLINNAGRSLSAYTVPSTELVMEEIKQTFATNLFAVMDINQTFLPLLLQAKGIIVNISSVGGITPFIFGGVYNSSKAALHSYADTLRVELYPFGVHVVTVITGGVKSNITRTDRHLAPTSLWTGFEAQYQRRLKYSQEVGQDTAVYARDVFNGVTTSRGWLWNSNEVWAGGGIRLVRIVQALDRWIPGGAWTFVQLRTAGLQNAGSICKKEV